MHYKSNENNKTYYSIKGKPKYLVVMIISILIGTFLLYIVGFYTYKFAYTYKALFKIGVNEELNEKNYSHQKFYLYNDGIELIYGENGDNVNIIFTVEKDNRYDLEPLKLVCEPTDDNLHEISIRNEDNVIKKDYKDVTKDTIKENYLSMDLFKSGDLSVESVKWNKVPNPFGKNDDFYMNANLKSSRENLIIDLKFLNKQIDLEIENISSIIKYGKTGIENDLVIEYKNLNDSKIVLSSLLFGGLY